MMDKLNEDEMIYESFLQEINKTNRNFSLTPPTPSTTITNDVAGASSSSSVASAAVVTYGLHWYEIINTTTSSDYLESQHFQDPGYILRYSITVTALLR